MGALIAVLAAMSQIGAANAGGPPSVDIDTADAATLASTLPGIGPVKARRIVEYRERHGPFVSLDALQGVKGIGPATVERIRAHLSARPASRAEGGIDGDGATGSDGGAGARLHDDEPRSTTELERATRDAVREIVVRARREAAAGTAFGSR